MFLFFLDEASKLIQRNISETLSNPLTVRNIDKEPKANRQAELKPLVEPLWVQPNEEY